MRLFENKIDYFKHIFCFRDQPSFLKLCLNPDSSKLDTTILEGVLPLKCTEHVLLAFIWKVCPALKNSSMLVLGGVVVRLEFYCDENNPAAFVLRGLLD